jgi:hypothetical protein
MDDLIVEAREIGLRDAGAYIRKFGGYPRQGDADEFGCVAWLTAWEELLHQGADEALHDACFEAWLGGFLGMPVSGVRRFPGRN